MLYEMQCMCLLIVEVMVYSKCRKKNSIFVTLFASKVYRTQTKLILLQIFDMPEVQLIDLFVDKSKCALFKLAAILKDTSLTQL